MGHFVTGIILKLNVKEIRVFFFGGVTVLEEDLNLCIYKEILLIIMGPETYQLMKACCQEKLKNKIKLL